ncbi:hypothetical protein Tco_1374217, partial [Tanacetum coccineum]
MSLMHRWHDTIRGGVIGPRRSLFGAYGCILGSGNDKQAVTKGRNFGSTTNHAASAS